MKTGKDTDKDKEASSEVSTTQPDSAYSSLGPSVYSSLASIRNEDDTIYTRGTSVTKSTSNPSSKSSWASDNSKQKGGALSYTASTDRMPIAVPKIVKKKESTERSSRKKKPKGTPGGKEGSSPSSPRDEGGTGGPSTFNNTESKATKNAILSQALGLVDQFRKKQAYKNEAERRAAPYESELHDLAVSLLRASQKSQSPTQPIGLADKERIPTETIVRHETKDGSGGFCVAVSLHNGMVMQTTPSITSLLGYPKDMLVGRSFIDFLHPQNRQTFIDQVTENIGIILRNSASSARKEDMYRNTGGFFCRIRMYNGLKSGFSVKERRTRYNPFKLSVCFSDCDGRDSSATESGPTNNLGPESTLLFITAIPLASVYREPYEDMSKFTKEKKPVFVTKHNSSGILNASDESAIPYLGYLPQDMDGEELINYIHPGDLHGLKEVFTQAMIMQGKPVKGGSLRLRTRNGGFITVNSWWSCFINPWSRQLEFVHGKHCVTQGPRFPDVFDDIQYGLDESALLVHSRQMSAIKTEIKSILRQTVQRNSLLNSEVTSSSKVKKELSTFMGSLLEEVAAAELKKQKQESIPCPAAAVVIGNISPHQSDSSETPPSYTQLTYNENLTRFFCSEPKTMPGRFTEDSEKTTETAASGGGGQDLVCCSKTSADNRSGGSKDTSGGGTSKVTVGSKDSKRLDKSHSRRLSVNKEDGGQSGLGSGGSGENAQTTSGSGEGNGNNSSTLQVGLSAGQLQTGRDDGMMSMDGSGGSGSRMGSGNSQETSTDAYNPPVLTEELLQMHNKDMEKKMLCKYKQDKKSGDLSFLQNHKHKLGVSNIKRMNTPFEQGKATDKPTTLPRAREPWASATPVTKSSLNQGLSSSREIEALKRSSITTSMSTYQNLIGGPAVIMALTAPNSLEAHGDHRPASLLLQKRYLRGKSPPRIIEGGKEGLNSTNLVVSSCIRCHTSQEKGERNKSPVGFKQTGEKFARPHSRKLVKTTK